MDETGDNTLRVTSDYYEKELANFGPTDSEFVTLPQLDGKLVAELIVEYCEDNNVDYLAFAPRVRVENEHTRVTEYLLLNCKCNLIFCKN